MFVPENLMWLVDDAWTRIAPRKKEQKEQKEIKQATRRIEPAISVDEDNDCAYVEFLVPGFDPKSLSIKIAEGMLEVSGECTGVRKKEWQGSFYKELQLSAQIDSDAIGATCQDGVLTICLPRIKEKKKREVKIN